MNTETKQFEGHTPGPWQDAEGDFDGPPVVIKLINESRLRIAVCDFSTYRMALNSISLRTSETEDVTQFSTKVERANAALIAAAPELLKERDTLKEKNSELADQVIKLMKERDGAVTVSNIAEAREARYSEALNESKSLNAELLEALRHVKNLTGNQDLADICEAAIAKAEGGNHAS